jgi:hypothetical protein
MGTANTKSTAVTNADATPVVFNNRILTKGVLYEAVGTVEVAAADDDNSVYRVARVPSNARISSVEVFNDAITGGTAYHVGLHQTAANGGAAAAADVFATSVDLSSANLTPLEVTYEALNIDKIEKRVYELLGETTDTQRDYDLTLTGATVGSGAGTISVRVRYTI